MSESTTDVMAPATKQDSTAAAQNGQPSQVVSADSGCKEVADG